MIFTKLNNEEYSKKLNQFDDYLVILTMFHKQTSDKFVDLIGSISVWELERKLNQIKSLRDEFVKQQNCRHLITSGLQFVGNDSHKDFYKDICVNCNAVINYESI